MSKPYRPIPYEEVLAKLSPERQARVKARGDELIAEEFALRDLRRARRLTQEQLADKLGGKQVYVSRLEKRGDMKLSSLRGYVKALGGELQLMVTFPEDDSVRIKDIGATPKRAKAKAPSRKASRTRALKSA